MNSILCAFVGGLMLVACLPQLPGPWLQCLLMVAIAVAATSRRMPAYWLAAFGCGVLLACIYGQNLLAQRLPEYCLHQPLTVTGTIASLPQRLPVQVREVETEEKEQDATQVRFELQVEYLQPAHCQGPKQLLLSHHDQHELLPGQRWQLGVRLRRPSGLENPGSFNHQAWYAQQGIDAVGSVRKGQAQLLDTPLAVSQWHHRLRHRIRQQIAALPLSRDARAVLLAITVGDRSLLEHRLWRLCQYFGVNHLLVISGLHVGLVAGLGYGLGRLLALPGLLRGGTGPARLPIWLALLFAFIYTLLSGFSVATQRAMIMLCCMAIASLCWRRPLAWQNLLLAAVLILLFNPLAALGGGFWLSFAAVAALLWLGLWRGPGRSYKKGDKGTAKARWRHVIGCHIYMCLVMVPLGGWWFGSFSQVAAVANLLLVPLLGFYLVPLALLAACAFVFGLEEVAISLWQYSALPLEWLIPQGQALLASRPNWLLWQLSVTVPALLLAALAVGLFVLPVSLRFRVLAVLMLLPLLLPPRWPRTATPEAVHILFMDVGQGTAVLIYNRQYALLYDTGGGIAGGQLKAETVILPLLRQRALYRLDTLVISHGDTDHSAGLPALLAGVDIGELIVGPDMRAESEQFKTADLSIQSCRAGRTWRWGTQGPLFRFLSPTPAEQLSANAGSCVLQVNIDSRRLLLSGDIDQVRERELIRYWGRELASNWLLAAHHGSGGSSGWAWLKAVDPEWLVFSRSYGNRFHHPHPAVRERAQIMGANLLDTARLGAIEVQLQPGEEPILISYRKRNKRYWK
ncbi:MAG: DNA internalization-related competence protein ComEC/Rec2 [Parahaliea sp.]